MFLSIVKGVASSGKVAYFTAIYPYVVLLVLLITGALKDGATDGMWYFIKPQWGKILEAKASGNIFYFLPFSKCYENFNSLENFFRCGTQQFRSAFSLFRRDLGRLSCTPAIILFGTMCTGGLDTYFHNLVYITFPSLPWLQGRLDSISNWHVHLPSGWLHSFCHPRKPSTRSKHWHWKGCNVGTRTCFCLICRRHREVWLCAAGKMNPVSMVTY